MIEKVAVYYPRAMHGDGGVTNSLWLWSESLQRAGVGVEVLYDPRLPVSPRRHVPCGVTIRPVPHRGGGRFCRPYKFGDELDPTALLVLHSGYTAFNLVAGDQARRCGVPFVVVPHGAYDGNVRQRKKAVKSVWEIAERRLLENAAAVHVFFDAEIEDVHRLAPAARTITAATAFSLPEAEWSLKGAENYIAWLGRYDVRHKGLDRLFDAMILLPPEQRPPLRLHGRDHRDSRQVVQTMVDKRGLRNDVTVGGSIDGPAKHSFLMNAAAYIHPARWESLPVALVESLALGIPCLTTTDINLGLELKEAGAALVVDGNVDGLAQGIAAVAAGAVTPCGARGRDFVRNQLSHAVAGRTFVQEMDTLMRAEVT